MLWIYSLADKSRENKFKQESSQIDLRDLEER